MKIYLISVGHDLELRVSLSLPLLFLDVDSNYQHCWMEHGILRKKKLWQHVTSKR